MSESRILVRLLRMYFSMELGIQLSFVKTSEFWGGGGLNTPNPPRYATAGSTKRLEKFAVRVRERVLSGGVCPSWVVALVGFGLFGPASVYLITLVNIRRLFISLI